MATARVLHLPLVQPRRDDAADRTHLRLVRGARNGLGLSPRVGVVLTVLAFVGLFAVAVCHALLIERQASIDELDARVAEEQARYEDLSLEVAELESPERIRTVATEELGMVPAGEVVWLTPQEPAPAGDAADDEVEEEDSPDTSAARVKPYMEATP
jgi:cell division protein FtsL